MAPEETPLPRDMSPAAALVRAGSARFWQGCGGDRGDDMHSLPEWTDLRFFLELARAGTLSGASRRLEVEHTTVARRIDRLEQQLGTTLFDRSREGYELTEMGQALLPHAEAMEGAALAATEQLGGARWRRTASCGWACRKCSGCASSRRCS